MFPSFLRLPFAVRPTSFLLALELTACVAEQEPAPQGAIADVGSSANQAAPDGGLLRPDAADAATSATPAADQTSELTTLAEFRGTVDVAAGTMRLEVLRGEAVTDAGLRRAQQGLCTLTIVQDGVPGSGPADSLELVTASTGLDAACDGYLASPLFCGAVTVRSFYASPQTQVFAQILALAPSTGFSVQNGDLVPGASSGLGSWAYGDLGDAAAAPANAGVRNWVFARSGGNFTFTGRLVANVPELCDGLDNDCDGATDEGLGCRTQGQDCTATVDCSADLVCTASVCSPAGCPSGEHVEAGTCASDTRSCTAPDATVATETWTGAAYGPCTASACLPTHHLEGADCLSNTGSCTVENGSGSRSYNAGAWSSCTLTGCNTGFHVLSGACTSSTQSCTLADGTGSQSWLGSAWGVCIPTGCDAGYHAESGACAGDARNCLLTGGAGDQTWNGSSWNSCVASACYGAFTLSDGTCVAAGCGNSLVEAGEACDDGNLVATDGCTATCTVAACGDGLVQAGVEGCDDGNMLTEECNYGEASCTVCTDTCVSAAGETDLCGDAVVDAAEGCDDGNTVDDDSCSNSCLCGSGYHVESGVCTSDTRDCVAANAIIAFESWTGSDYTVCTAYACDSTTYHVESGVCLSDTRNCLSANATTATQSWTGSDYTVCAATSCDAGYSLLSELCVAAGCGNGAAEAGEACDDGNTVATDGCTSTCTVAACGDGVVQAGVDGCDDGNTVTEECGYGAASCAVCSATCTSVAGETDICGDGTLDAAEVCDDGNTANGDSCSSACLCGTGFHLEGGVCTSDTRFCPLDYGIGTEQWNGSSYGSTCSVATCDSGYHIAANSCAADVVSCTLANATAATQTWSSGTGSYGSCTASACDTTYHVESGACAANIRVCTLANGTATETWTGSGYGACTVRSCNSTYHGESGACLSNSRNCSLPNATVATESWTGSAYGSCTATACASGYAVNAGACALHSTLGTACTANAECASGFCATDPTGTANDRCAPTGMNYIPAGTFTMGSPAGELGQGTDETQHSVTISRSFFMGQTEVTQGQWKALSGGLNPSWFQSTTVTTQTTTNANDSGPVETLDWYAAVAFANARSAAEGLTSCYTLTGCTDPTNGWKDGIHSGCTGATFAGLTCTGYRLPTESEWEYAARAGTTTATYGGDLSAISGCATLSGTGGFAAGTALGSLAWYNCNTATRTQAVGGKTSNAFGLYDVLGNAWEWTGDWYNATYPGTVTDPTGPLTGTYHATRGSSWRNAAQRTRSASRSLLTYELRNDLGIRLARTVTRSCASLPLSATAGIEAATATGWGACEVSSCSATYHLEGGACLSDTRACFTLPANTTAGTQTWTGSAYGSCTATTCASGYWVNAGACALQSTLGAACTANAACASNFCATGPDGTAYDRCAPEAMNYIPAGTFTMGSPSGEVGRATNETQHSVTLSRSFFMGQTEVTQGQWKALSGGINPSCFQSTAGTACTTSNANDSGPVEKIDWYSAVGFANARSAAEGLTSCYTLTGCTDAVSGWQDGIHSGCTAATFAGLSCTGYRLPTESEWEYAARAGTTTATYGGDLSAISGCATLSGTGGFAAGTAFSSLAWYGCNAASRTNTVGGKTPNTYGLYDMLGNVFEFTGDWNGTYPGTVTDPLGAATGIDKVCRGGGWTYGPDQSRAALRNLGPPGLRWTNQGFRLARTGSAPAGMTYIPAGTFTMGSPSGEVGRATDETEHSVTISRSFFMGQTELTQGQWKALSGGTNPSCFQSTTGTACTTSNANDSGPAENLDWYAAVAFANARSASEGLTSCYTLTGCTDAANGWQDGIHSGCTGATFAGLTCTGYRLPTESEWEYAARAGTTTATYGGNLSAITGCATLSGTGGFAAGTALGSLAWYDCNAASRTQAVGGKTPNVIGLSDMLGNAHEWTADWYGTYPGTVTDPLGATTGSNRVFRGGSWWNIAGSARAANRRNLGAGFHDYTIGFRLVRTAF